MSNIHHFVAELGVNRECFKIKITTKWYGKKNSWTLGPCSSDGSYGSNEEYVQTCCLAPGTYNLECKGTTWLQGWGGGYIEVNGTKYCKSFSTRGVHTAQITLGGMEMNVQHECCSLTYLRGE